MEIQLRLWGHPQHISDSDDHDYNLHYDNEGKSINKNRIINQQLIF
jgi:hypothetical protein